MAGGSMHRAAWLPLLLAGLCPSEIRGDGGRPTKNITVYRVTPVNLTGIADRNTGDAAGDIFFTLYVAIAPVYCRTNPLDSICNITQSVLGDEHINVYVRCIAHTRDRLRVRWLFLVRALSPSLGPLATCRALRG